jgi:hypothetical protein
MANETRPLPRTKRADYCAIAPSKNQILLTIVGNGRVQSILAFYVVGNAGIRRTGIAIECRPTGQDDRRRKVRNAIQSHPLFMRDFGPGRGKDQMSLRHQEIAVVVDLRLEPQN